MKTVEHADSRETIGNLLQSGSYGLDRRIENDAKNALTHFAEEDADVKLFATITDPRTNTTDVVKIAQYKATDLYAFAQSPIIDFNNAICQALNRLQATLRESEFTEAEINSTYFWNEIRQLRTFLGTSPGHDEAIVALLQVCAENSKRAFERKWQAGLLLALESLRDNIIVSDNVLDSFYDALESAGFDLDLPIAGIEELE